MDDAIKALKTVAAVSRPGGPIHQAAAAGIRALDDERAAREQAERGRDRALVAGAVLLRAAREALAAAQARAADDRQALEGVAAKLREDRRFGGDVYAVLDPALNRAPGAHDAIDAALKAFAGSVEVEKWIERGLLMIANYVADAGEEVPLHGSGEEADRIVAAMLASPPALPSASEALAAFAAWVRDECALTAGEGGEVDGEHGGVITLPRDENAAENVRGIDPADLVRRWLEREGR